MPKKKMPKLPPPRDISIFDQIDLAHRGIAAISAGAKKTSYLNLYPPEVLNSICSKHEIENSEVIETLWHFLEFQAVQHHDISQRSEARASNAEIRTELSDVIKTLETLISRLEKLHPDTALLFLKVQSDYQDNILKEFAAASTAPNTAALSARSIIQFDDVLPHLKLLQNLSEAVQGKITRGKDGRRLNRPLYVWVSSLAGFWTNVLKRPFTIDTYKGARDTKGVGITQSYAFLRDCLTPLAPAEIDYLPSTMRYVRDGRSPYPKKG